jgi:hypothetical protein
VANTVHHEGLHGTNPGDEKQPHSCLVALAIEGAVAPWVQAFLAESLIRYTVTLDYNASPDCVQNSLAAEECRSLGSVSGRIVDLNVKGLFLPPLYCPFTRPLTVCTRAFTLLS